MSFPQADLDAMWEKAIAGVPKIRIGQAKIARNKVPTVKSKFYPKTPPKSWLSDDTVRNIRQALIHGEITTSIAKRYKVHRVVVSQIKRGLTYRHVQ